ncbi:cell shape-determining protein [Prauserella marina]|uniref:Arabinosyltransferase C n=1 Tax=Prauserella marina TaxID=530584 RepID=A0A222VJ82_9PSEU|nr:arabinosyltransferase domain-containing protein [Prauserella marina]ASR33771.1 cell shape-determining protein [Prauserella marina]PWV82346.1 EmbC-like arabinotransferase in arabinogalactan biosynthesis [Prauserella marina]SDC66950.1 arabinosyltransferase C [Prauserella marina]
MGSRRWTIAGLGLFAALSAVLFVLAPVDQDVTTYEWPSAGTTESTALPLLPYEPERLDVEFGCADAAALGGTGTVLSTDPPGAEPDKDAPALRASVADGLLTVAVGEKRLASFELSGDCTVTIRSGEETTSVSVNGEERGRADLVPSVSGLFTDLSGQTGLHATVVPDTRYESSPSALKIAFGALAIGALLSMLFALRRWEAPFRRHVRLLPPRWWRPTLPDAVVVLTLVTWTIIGASTVDDGYIITMIQSASDTGFVGNYYRWFNAPESPFSWFYELYRPFAELSAATWWMRVPSLVLGLASWFLIDRVLLRRFAKAPALTARWTAAVVFLLWYLAFGIGLRPEPWIVLGSLAVFALVERALATRSLGTLCIALVVAGATLTITPTGVAAVIPFLVALPGIFRLLRDRGVLSVFAVLAAALSALLFMFYDQTLSTVLHSTEVRTAIGPSFGMLDEGKRYEDLFDALQGGLNRRMPLMLMWFAMAMLVVLLLARRAPRLAARPTIRLVGASALFFGALAFTPTKYTHHFGALAGFGTLLVAVLVHTIVRGALRRNWERSAVLVLLGLTVWIGLDAPLRWWFLSGLNVKWNLVVPGVSDISAATIVLVGAIVLALAGLVGAWRWLRQPGWLIAAVAAATVLVEVATMAHAMVPRWDTYTTGRANLASLSGGGNCGVEDWLRLEPDIRAGLLTETSPPTLDGFTRNAGFPAELRPLEPYGGDEAPVWGADGVVGSLTTGWYPLPEGAGAPGSPPLVVPATGKGSVSATVQFAGPDGTVTRESRVWLDSDPEWQDYRFDPKDATRVRVVADNTEGRGWIAVGTPRLPKVVPTTDVVPVSEPVMLDWVSAFTLSCRTSARLHDGIVEPVRYRFAAGPQSRALGSVSFVSAPGGTYAKLFESAEQVPVPTYLTGDKLFEPISVFRLDYPVPMRDLTVGKATR